VDKKQRNFFKYFSQRQRFFLADDKSWKSYLRWVLLTDLSWMLPILICVFILHLLFVRSGMRNGDRKSKHAKTKIESCEVGDVTWRKQNFDFVLCHVDSRNKEMWFCLKWPYVKFTLLRVPGDCIFLTEICRFYLKSCPDVFPLSPLQTLCGDSVNVYVTNH